MSCGAPCATVYWAPSARSSSRSSGPAGAMTWIPCAVACWMPAAPDWPGPSGGFHPCGRAGHGEDEGGVVAGSAQAGQVDGEHRRVGIEGHRARGVEHPARLPWTNLRMAWGRSREASPRRPVMKKTGGTSPCPASTGLVSGTSYTPLMRQPRMMSTLAVALPDTRAHGYGVRRVARRSSRTGQPPARTRTHRPQRPPRPPTPAESTGSQAAGLRVFAIPDRHPRLLCFCRWSGVGSFHRCRLGGGCCLRPRGIRGYGCRTG